MVVSVEEDVAGATSLELPSVVIRLFALTVKCWSRVALSVLQDWHQNVAARPCITNLSPGVAARITGGLSLWLEFE